MNPHSAFLDTILDAPDDDTPRLVYADWLEENGDPERAEFIRVQIRRAQLSPHARQQRALAARERALLQKHSRRWAEPLRGLDWRWRFGRGFVEAIQINLFQSETVQKLARVLPLAPIRVLSIPEFSPDGESVVDFASEDIEASSWERWEKWRNS